jgi:hypothetical protein
VGRGVLGRLCDYRTRSHRRSLCFCLYDAWTGVGTGRVFGACAAGLHAVLFRVITDSRPRGVLALLERPLCFWCTGTGVPVCASIQ